MEPRHIRYFIAVGEALSFTKAAQKLHLTQPSLTRQIQNLEDEIGVTSIDRSNNRVRLTEEGRRFLFDSKKVLAMCAESIATVHWLDHGPGSHCNIGHVENVQYGLLLATLGTFQKFCPSVGLNLFEMRSPHDLHAG